MPVGPWLTKPTMLIAWTGHRPDLFADPGLARRRLEGAARDARARYDSLRFISGGQRGVDQWAAEAGLALGVPVALVLPTPVAEFSKSWTEVERDRLVRIVGQADLTEVIDPDGSLGDLAFDRRNEVIVERADLVIAVWTGVRRGGTFYTLCAAWQAGTPVEEIVLGRSGAGTTTGRGM